MFEGVIERKSHENGLLAKFTGSSPALGSIMVLEKGEDYVGKVDSVLCNADDPLIHIAHLDFKADINAMIGQKIIIRKREPDSRRGGRDRRDSRGYERDNRGSSRGRFDRDRGGSRHRDRNDRQGGGRRDNNHRNREDSGRFNRRDSDNRRGGDDRYRNRGSGDRRSSDRYRGGGSGDRRNSDRSRGSSDNRRRNDDRFGSRNSDRTGGGRPRQSGQRNRFSQDRRGGDYRGKSGGARQNRDRDSDRNGPTAKSPWQKNKPTFEKKPAKTFRKAKGKKGGHAHNLGPKEIKPRKYEKRD